MNFIILFWFSFSLWQHALKLNELYTHLCKSW